MNKALTLSIIAGDVLLIIFAIVVCDFVSSDISRFVVGSPTDRLLWMLAVVVVAPIIAVMTLRRDVARRPSLNTAEPPLPSRAPDDTTYAASALRRRRQAAAILRVRKSTMTPAARSTAGKKKRHVEAEYFDRHAVGNRLLGIDQFAARRAHR